MSDLPRQPSSPMSSAEDLHGVTGAARAVSPPLDPPAEGAVPPGRRQDPSGVVETAGIRATESDLQFINDLSAASLMEDLHGEELARIAAALGESEGIQRHLDFLERYYGSEGDEDVSYRRRLADRFFLVRADEYVTAKQLVDRLAALAPELADIGLERIGTDDGPLVLRSGEQFAAIVDDHEENLDTGEIDLSELEQPTVTVRGLVRALNTLLERHDVRERLVTLRADEMREAYVGVTVMHAMALCQAGRLEEETPEEVMDLAGW